ncbi:uncharacterized protein (TIGR01655 family) [Scopulibacillus daqui]|uniref:Uncharacterized protein (TIGR01655 family) n=1 Tax=Scopulibacillus daqui TaxID=1469162 RepID=A0ABS2Q349_9BACL|nr:YxeA family protein [Scopulibacillus daqui]MBM7645952.1 uncharacterized protein (TIGR01655 family) [Scopulibacillus daqui]
MKKYIPILAIALVFTVLLTGCNFNRLGADQYYVQIKGKGHKVTDSGFTRYEYRLPAYDKDGNKKQLEFSAEKQLREGAYLTLYVKEKKGVTSYQEVDKKDVPPKAKEKL